MEDLSGWSPPPSLTFSDSNAPFPGFLFPQPKQMAPVCQPRSVGSSPTTSARALAPPATFSNRHAPYPKSCDSKQMRQGCHPGSIRSNPEHSVTSSRPLLGGGCRIKKTRNRLTIEQTLTLMEVFAETPKPESDIHIDLSQRLNIELKVIRAWFKNRRAKVKREMDSRTFYPPIYSPVDGYEAISYGNLRQTANGSYTSSPETSPASGYEVISHGNQPQTDNRFYTSAPNEISRVGGHEVISYANMPQTAIRSYTSSPPKISPVGAYEVNGYGNLPQTANSFNTSFPPEVSPVGGYDWISHLSLLQIRSYTYMSSTSVAYPEQLGPFQSEFNPKYLPSVDPEPNPTTASTHLFYREPPSTGLNLDIHLFDPFLIGEKNE